MEEDDRAIVVVVVLVVAVVLVVLVVLVVVTIERSVVVWQTDSQPVLDHCCTVTGQMLSSRSVVACNRVVAAVVVVVAGGDHVLTMTTLPLLGMNWDEMIQSYHVDVDFDAVGVDVV